MLSQYATHPGLLQRLGEFNVEVTFGMHFGWAIEGAIGSEFKVDVSYLSTHVNMAMHVEALVKDMDVGVLMTEALRSRLSVPMAEQVRVLNLDSTWFLDELRYF